MYISSEKNPLGSKYHFLYPYSSETFKKIPKKTFRHPYDSYESYLFTQLPSDILVSTILTFLLNIQEDTMAEPGVSLSPKMTMFGLRKGEGDMKQHFKPAATLLIRIRKEYKGSGSGAT